MRAIPLYASKNHAPRKSLLGRAGAMRRLKERDDQVPEEDAAAEGDDVQEELGEEAAEASDTESHAYL